MVSLVDVGIEIDDVEVMRYAVLFWYTEGFTKPTRSALVKPVRNTIAHIQQ